MCIRDRHTMPTQDADDPDLSKRKRDEGVVDSSAQDSTDLRFVMDVAVKALKTEKSQPQPLSTNLVANLIARLAKGALSQKKDQLLAQQRTPLPATTCSKDLLLDGFVNSPSREGILEEVSDWKLPDFEIDLGQPNLEIDFDDLLTEEVLSDLR
eukprot:TRINITY_DN3255_c0_g1_i3.p1 TRINITY_DN3255_c0_g1~~TRINITY_DN3255_c0_g1_i3.p1  ORF type:complete len:154 (-),score=24.02 TRINITY_DN3255_c0_g1_i3:156-617(-)